MKNRYLLGASVALAVALGSVEANAQLPGGPCPVAYYLGPEGGWTSLSDQKNKLPPFPDSVTVNGVPGAIPGSVTTKYDSGYNVGVRAGIQWGPIRVEEEYS